METLISQIAYFLNDTFSSDNSIVTSATESLDRAALLNEFPSALLAICNRGENQGQRIAAATYLKNYTRRRIDGKRSFSNQFRNQLVESLLRAEPAVLKVLVEAFRMIINEEFVKENSWPELVPELRLVIQNSNLISGSPNSQWNTINALTVLQAIIRPFQYFLNPNVAKESVPPQLDLIAKEILLHLLAVFHGFVEKALSIRGKAEMDIEQVLLIVCKCIYFSVRSHMPSALVPSLPSFSQDLFRILDSLSFDDTASEDGFALRLKTGKRALLIFCALVTRHRKHSDKLMPNIVTCASKIVKQSINISKLDFLPERIVSLGFDVISRVLETGPGWRLVSPHFSTLLESAIFPALVMNKKGYASVNPVVPKGRQAYAAYQICQDASEWEEDPDEYIRKNLPTDIEEISGWKEDLFTARKSAINLLGIISMSKGPPTTSSKSSIKRKKGEKNKGKEQRSSVGELLVLPFLSKFPIPASATSGDTMISKNYYGVLMAYGGLQDFLSERNPGYTATLIRTRVLPLYSLSAHVPFLIATANWVLGELASCLPEDMTADIYSSLLKALTTPDLRDISCYPVRASAAGAVTELLENEYYPPDWLPLLQVIVNRMDSEDDNESSVLLQLLSTIVEAGNESVIAHIPYVVSALVGTISKHIPPIPEPWPQVVERGFSALAVMAKTWEDHMPEEDEPNESSEKLRSSWATLARAFSVLLQQAWLTPMELEGGEFSYMLPPPSCLDDASVLLQSILGFVIDKKEVLDMKISELLTVWADLIADWHGWEELEDLSIFNCIQGVVNLHRKCDLKNFFVREMPPPPAPPVPQCSIIEGLGAFVSDAIFQYPSATWRACSCVHLLLHVPKFSFETEGVKQSLVIAFTQAALFRFKEIQSKPSALWRPLLLVISSCYLCYPDVVEKILDKDEKEGFTTWVSALGHISTSSFEPGLSSESEIKLIVMGLAKVVERLLGPSGNPMSGLVRDCFISLIEAVIRLKEVQEEDENGDDGDEDDEEDEDTDDDEDSEDDDDEHEETEEEFLERYAKEAADLENGVDLEEGDIDDQDQELELGMLGEIDPQKVAFSLMEKYNQVLVNGQPLPTQLITGFLNVFPEYAYLFKHC